MRQMGPLVYAWSVYRPEQRLNANGHFVQPARGEPGALVDPVPFLDGDAAQLGALGGVVAVVVTLPDRVGEALRCRDAFGCQLLAVPGLPGIGDAAPLSSSAPLPAGLAAATLPAGERDVTVLFYFLGYSQAQIGRLLRLKPGTVGKRLHSARLRIRRLLPPSVRGDILRLTPSPAFVQQVRLGLFDEYVGEYRFDRHPDHVVSISREGQSLISRASGQRHVLSSVAEDSLLTCLYDGEGRFHRDRRGKITHFVYYEFGKRMGIARKIDRRE